MEQSPSKKPRDLVAVDQEALRTVLQALNGPGHLIRELQAIRSLGSSPIDILIADFNKSMQEQRDKGQQAYVPTSTEEIAAALEVDRTGWTAMDYLIGRGADS